MKKGMMTLVLFLTTYVFGDISSNFTLSSNYIWRGMTQTMDSPGYSGGFDYSSESGFYAGTWGSNVSFGGAGLEPAPPNETCLLYTSPSPRDGTSSRMPSSA